ncbi:MAG: NUDIX domain-containing protein [Planctomycetes bacterium]|nr:NUDIX domain-containing protein [Planctomycetota bacterium]
MNPVNENSELFKHCPKCGAPELQLLKNKLFKCSACDFGFYFNTATAVGALITNEKSELLVTIRAKQPAKGTWDLPGGFVDLNESAEQAVKREIKEELNLDITSTQYFCSVPNIYKYKNVTYPTVDFAYFAKVNDFSQIKALDDVASFLFVPPAELDPEKFGLISVKKIITNYLETLGSAEGETLK